MNNIEYTHMTAEGHKRVIISSCHKAHEWPKYIGLCSMTLVPRHALSTLSSYCHLIPHMKIGLTPGHVGRDIALRLLRVSQPRDDEAPVKQQGSLTHASA